MDTESTIIISTGSPTKMTGVYSPTDVMGKASPHIHYVLDTEDMWKSAVRVARLVPLSSFDAHNMFNHLRSVFNLRKP